MVTARFRVMNVNDYGTYRQVFLTPVLTNDPQDPNHSWSKYTPSGKLEMTITNPTAYEQFKVGKLYHMTFEEVAE